MNLVKETAILQKLLREQKERGKTMGFVPTMGALHSGHLKLVETARTENDICVVSIFVNPTQFNNEEDLVKYPRTLDRDMELLKPLGVDYVFAPSVDGIYPEEDTRIFDFGNLDKVMEGYFRPGHFNGVAQVVSKLFDCVTPDRAYFGQKDFQQLAIIRELVKQQDYPIQIIPIPIVREASGLALSSRNERLSEDERIQASVIYQQLLLAKTMFDNGIAIATIKETIMSNLNNLDGFNVEYFDIVDGTSLKSLTSANSDYVVACIAVFCGNVRLIDNLVIRN